MSKSLSHYFPVKDLTTWTTRWVICGRVTEKSPINTFKRPDGSQSKVANINITDSNGDSIRATFWGNAADKWMPFLEQSQIYTFANGGIRVANKRFSNLSHKYELLFEVTAEIKKVEDLTEDLQKSFTQNEASMNRSRNYSFVSFRKIASGSRPSPYLVDLLAVLIRLSPNTEQQPGTRRQCSIADDSGYEMILTLFGPFTKAFDHIDNVGLQEPTILAIQNVQINQFRGGLNASTLRTTHIAIDPETDEARRLREWVLTLSPNYSFKAMSDNQSNEGTPFWQNDLASGNITLLKEVAEILPTMPLSSSPSLSQEKPSGATQDVFTVIAEPSTFLYANRSGEMSLFYPACTQCNRKLNQSDFSSNYRCEICLLDVETPNFKYVFGLYLVDSSMGRFLVRTFHDPGQIFLNRDPKDLAKNLQLKMQVSDLPPEIRQLLDYDALWKKYRIRLRARREIFADQERNNVSIIFAEPLNYERHGRYLLSKIEKALEKTKSTKRPKTSGALGNVNMPPQAHVPEALF